MHYSRILAVTIFSTNMQPLQLYTVISKSYFFFVTCYFYYAQYIRFVRGRLEPQFVYFSTGVAWIATQSLADCLGTYFGANSTCVNDTTPCLLKQKQN